MQMKLSHPEIIRNRNAVARMELPLFEKSKLIFCISSSSAVVFPSESQIFICGFSHFINSIFRMPRQDRLTRLMVHGSPVGLFREEHKCRMRTELNENFLWEEASANEEVRILLDQSAHMVIRVPA